VVQNFGVENEIVSLKTAILDKDNEIVALRSIIQEFGGSIPQV